MMNDVVMADLYRTMRNAVQNGGAIFYDRVPAGAANATAGGTAAARVSISTSYIIPNGAAELLAFAPGIAPTAAAAAQQILAIADIQGTSFKSQPQQVLAPISSVYLSVGSMRLTPQEWYKVCAKVVNGDQYDWGTQALIANAGNFKAWNDVMYSTMPSGDPTIYSQVQTTVNTGTAAGNATGGTLQLTAANALYEVATGLSPESAGVAGENQIMSTVFQCSALDPIQSFIYGQDAPAVIGTTSGDTQIPQISRYMPLGLRFKISNPTINYTDTKDVATTNNTTTTHMTRYTSF